MILRPYQEAAILNTAKGFQEFRKQLIVLPTGGGKTIVFSKLAERFHQKRNERTLILAHREELIEQAADKLRKATGLSAGIEKAERHASLDDSVVVASVQTLQGSRLQRWPADHFGLVVPDEAHHALADQWQATLNHFDQHARVAGFTATPGRGDKRSLSNYFENVAFEMGMLDLIRDGYLSKVLIRSIPLKIDLSTVRAVAGDLNDGQLSDALMPYLKQIAEVIANVCKGRKIAVFLPLIETSKKFVEECQRAGINARHIDGKSPDRKEILEAFGRGEFELISNAMLLTEGWDETSVDCVVILRPTKLRELYQQMVGRGARLHPGKKNMLLLDFLWMHEKHNLAGPASLIAKNPAEEEAITNAILREEVIDLEDAESTATAEREAALARELANTKKRTERLIDIEGVAALLKDLKLREYAPTMKWEGAPASEKQRALLARFGVKAPVSRGEASVLMDRMFQRSKDKLASVKQLLWLIKLGHPSPQAATAKEAKAFLDAKWGKMSTKRERA